MMVLRAVTTGVIAMVLAASCEQQQPKTQPGEPSRERTTAVKNGPILKGRILDEAGQPLAGVRVTLFGGFATRFKGQEAETDKNGAYAFDPLRSGSHIKDEENQSWDQFVGMELFHPTQVSADGFSWWDIRVPGIDRHEYIKDFKMMAGGDLVGTVVDAASGNGVSDLDLRVISPSPHAAKFSRYARTDAEGRFSATALYPGEYVVDVNSQKLGYPVLGKIKVEAKKAAEVRFAFRQEIKDATE